ncbi:MAG: hypothetical protein ACK41F_08900 [Fimbriimonadaceae bacterium]
MDDRFLRALDAAADLEPTVANRRRLAQRWGDDAARWAFEQADLRRRAARKFPEAHRMLFDREGLEMASSDEASRHHASLFPRGELVADLTAGVGADLIALARRGPALGFEKDPDRAALARFNLASLGLEAEVRCGNCLEARWDFDFAFADPARRSGETRSSDPMRSEPPLTELLPRLRPLRLAALKLSPLASDAVLESVGGRVRFLGCGWECREALVLLGSDVRDPGAVEAALADGPVLGSEPGGEAAEEPAEWLHEAHPAAIRAGCLGALARDHGLALLGDSNGYLTGSRRAESPWLRAYRVLWSAPADTKRTQRALRELGARVAEVKHRAPAPPVAPRAFRPEGDRPLSLIVWPNGRSLRHALAEGPV